jgi:hypothetical protein
MRHDVSMALVEDPSLTLSEGLESYFAANERLVTTRGVSEDAAHFFRCHDVAHVVFGCDTTLLGEGTVKLWTIFGTTLRFWKHLRGYSEADAFSLFRQYSRHHLAKNLGRLIVSMPRTIQRARRVRHRWPWSDHDAYLDTTLHEIRSEFGIELSAAS